MPPAPPSERELDVREPADAHERVADLAGLRRELRLVGEVLEAAAAAGRVMGARSLDALGARLDDFDCERLGMAALDLRDPCPHRVARQAAANEDDEAVQPRDAVAAVRERVDPDVDLLVDLHRRGHGLSLAAVFSSLAKVPMRAGP